MTDFIEWDDKYGVDIPETDEFRKKLLDMFNSLIKMKKENADGKDITNLITEINDFSKIYFSREEKLLAKRKYPDLDVHSKSHRQFIKKAIGLRREIAEDVNNLPIEDIISLRDWLLEHFTTNDSLFVPFLRIHGYIEEVESKK